MGVGLVKVYKALIRLVMGALSIPFLCLCQKLSLSFFTVIKLWSHKSSEYSSPVPGPEAKSFSSEITNPTPFTLSYHNHTDANPPLSFWLCTFFLSSAFNPFLFLPVFNIPDTQRSLGETIPDTASCSLQGTNMWSCLSLLLCLSLYLTITPPETRSYFIFTLEAQRVPASLLVLTGLHKHIFIKWNEWSFLKSLSPCVLPMGKTLF